MFNRFLCPASLSFVSTRLRGPGFGKGHDMEPGRDRGAPARARQNGRERVGFAAPGHCIGVSVLSLGFQASPLSHPASSAIALNSGCPLVSTFGLTCQVTSLAAT